MKAEKWSGELYESAKYVEEYTTQDVEYILVTKYARKGDNQPYHDDLNSANRPTQVTNVVLGPDRILEIKFKNGGFKLTVKLKEGRIYIFTHLFNKFFLHRYIHKSNNINYSITFRSEN